MPRPSLQEVVDGALGLGADTVGYNATFVYPPRGRHRSAGPGAGRRSSRAGGAHLARPGVGRLAGADGHLHRRVGGALLGPGLHHSPPGAGGAPRRLQGLGPRQRCARPPRGSGPPTSPGWRWACGGPTCSPGTGCTPPSRSSSPIASARPRRSSPAPCPPGTSSFYVEYSGAAEPGVLRHRGGGRSGAGADDPPRGGRALRRAAGHSPRLRPLRSCLRPGADHGDGFPRPGRRSSPRAGTGTGSTPRWRMPCWEDVRPPAGSSAE